MFRDLSSGLYWSKAASWSTRTWENSITYCDGLTLGSYSDWRIPTHKEIMWAYSSGIMDGAKGMNIGNANYWSATTSYYATSEAMIGVYDSGIFYGVPKTNTNRVMCVRP